MIKPFKQFINEQKVRRAEPNIRTAKSLLDGAKMFLKMCESVPLTEEIAPGVLLNAYEAAREASQSLMAMYGYKPYSHEAVISFLAEHSKINLSTIHKLDSLRIVRNDVAYKAERVDIVDAENAIELAKELISKIASTQLE